MGGMIGRNGWWRTGWGKDIFYEKDNFNKKSRLWQYWSDTVPWWQLSWAVTLPMYGSCRCMRHSTLNCVQWGKGEDQWHLYTAVYMSSSPWHSANPPEEVTKSPKSISTMFSELRKAKSISDTFKDSFFLFHTNCHKVVTKYANDTKIAPNNSQAT